MAPGRAERDPGEIRERRSCLSGRCSAQQVSARAGVSLRRCTHKSRSVGHGLSMSVLGRLADSKSDIGQGREVPKPDFHRILTNARLAPLPSAGAKKLLGSTARLRLRSCLTAWPSLIEHHLPTGSALGAKTCLSSY